MFQNLFKISLKSASDPINTESDAFHEELVDRYVLGQKGLFVDRSCETITVIGTCSLSRKLFVFLGWPMNQSVTGGCSDSK